MKNYIVIMICLFSISLIFPQVSYSDPTPQVKPFPLTSNSTKESGTPLPVQPTLTDPAIAWPSNSDDKGKDGLSSYFTRSSNGQMDEEKSYSYTCPQTDPPDPEIEVDKIIDMINSSIKGGGKIGGDVGEGPKSGTLKYKWNVYDNEGNKVGGGDGANFSHTFIDPTEPNYADVKCKIKYDHRKFIVFPQ